MFKPNTVIVVLALAALTAGCGNFQSLPGQTDQTVLFAGDAGVGCAAIPLLAPNTVSKAREAIGCANAVFGGDEINMDAVVKCAQSNGVPNEYTAVLGVVLARVKVRMGGSLFPKDSVGGEALKAFLATCTVALG